MDITCKKCGSVYELDYDKTYSRDKDSIHCLICGELLYEWDEAKIWNIVKVIQKSVV